MALVRLSLKCIGSIFFWRMTSTIAITEHLRWHSKTPFGGYHKNIRERNKQFRSRRSAYLPQADPRCVRLQMHA
ncbi:hypothetical protein K491DRAFT_260855 [Lophiostoma macrostomum CBS 122681]|uniref:Uncharacterized protein n=1 Tax=Lophiostoma macrostomum CBS 122681 TaxID=1314788 RepID=A0A6A6SJT8_9PLEO|nr:hypothetical protein K491DRAFT_260855 [Lophiostoma macrostomum CBS 122681]